MIRAHAIAAGAIVTFLAANCGHIDVTDPSPPWCTYTLTPTSAHFPSIGGVLTVKVTCDNDCLWSIDVSPDWVKVMAMGGRGNGTFTFQVAANQASTAREGSITVGDHQKQTFSVTQDGAAR
jgi:hypothetical protein